MRTRRQLQLVEPEPDWRKGLPEKEREVLENILDPHARRVYETVLKVKYGL